MYARPDVVVAVGLQMKNKIPQSGHFYAVGVGPGDPDLLTLRAARLIENADVILAPQSKNSKNSLTSC